MYCPYVTNKQMYIKYGYCISAFFTPDFVLLRKTYHTRHMILTILK